MDPREIDPKKAERAAATLMKLRRMTGSEAVAAIRDLGEIGLSQQEPIVQLTATIALRDLTRSRPRAMQRLARDFLASGDGKLSMRRSMLTRLVMAILGSMSGRPKEEAAAEVEAHMADIADLSDQAAYQIIAGNARMLRDDRTGAYEAFARAAAIDLEHGGLMRQHIGAHSIRPWDPDPEWLRSGKSDIAPLSRGIEWQTLQRSPSTPMSLMLTGDVRYFERMAPGIVDDLIGLKSKTLVHFHVVGWNDACKAVTARCRAKYPTLSVTSEPYPFPKDFTYFASARFMRVASIQRQIGGAIFIMDLDDRVRTAPEDIWPLLEGYDFGVRFNGGENWAPWMGPGAQAVFIAYTPGGRRFAETMRNYMEHSFIPNGDRTWYYDQLLLNEVTHLLMRDDPELKVYDLMTVPQSGPRKAAQTRDLKSVRVAGVED